MLPLEEDTGIMVARFLPNSKVTVSRHFTHVARLSAFSAKNCSTIPYFVFNTNPFWLDAISATDMPVRSICSLKKYCSSPEKLFLLSVIISMSLNRNMYTRHAAPGAAIKTPSP